MSAILRIALLLGLLAGATVVGTSVYSIGFLHGLKDHAQSVERPDERFGSGPVAEHPHEVTKAAEIELD